VVRDVDSVEWGPGPPSRTSRVPGVWASCHGGIHLQEVRHRGAGSRGGPWARSLLELRRRSRDHGKDRRRRRGGIGIDVIGCCDQRRLRVTWVTWVTPLGLFTASIWKWSSSASSPSQSRSPRPSTMGTMTMPERGVQALPLAGAESVQRYREVVYPHLRQGDLLTCCFTATPAGCRVPAASEDDRRGPKSSSVPRRRAACAASHQREPRWHCWSLRTHSYHQAGRRPSVIAGL